jgi:DNA-binding transcriptional LysR family regulator
LSVYDRETRLVDRVFAEILWMSLTLRQLQIFCSIARSGSTSAAAEQVALSQSAASASLNELERTLGTSLFDRVGKRLVLNDKGRSILPAALALLDGAQALVSGLQLQSGRGEASLNLYASMTVGNYLLPPLLARYKNSAPGTRIQLLFGNTRNVIEAVQAFEADLGLIEGPCHASDITMVPWMEDELVIVASPDHPLASAAEPLTIRQLRAAKWLLREPGSGTRESIDNALRPHLQNLQVEMTLGSPEAIKNAAVEGLGIACVSRAVVRDLVDANQLRVLDTGLPRLTRQLALIHHEKKILSASLRRFIGYCLGEREDEVEGSAIDR